jgi:hypothetical protein
MTLTTARLALPYPEPNDTVDVPRDVQALAVKLDAVTPTYVQGASFAARPAAGVAGRTLPSEGHYDVTVQAQVWSNANSLVNAAISYTVGATAANDAWSAAAGFVGMVATVSCVTRQVLPGPTLTLVERARTSSTAGHTGNFGFRRILAQPVKIAA